MPQKAIALAERPISEKIWYPRLNCGDARDFARIEFACNHFTDVLSEALVIALRIRRVQFAHQDANAGPRSETRPASSAVCTDILAGPFIAVGGHRDQSFGPTDAARKLDTPFRKPQVESGARYQNTSEEGLYRFGKILEVCLRKLRCGFLPVSLGNGPRLRQGPNAELKNQINDVAVVPGNKAMKQACRVYGSAAHRPDADEDRNLKCPYDLRLQLPLYVRALMQHWSVKLAAKESGAEHVHRGV